MPTVAPVERRAYFPVGPPEGGPRRACPACQRPTMVPWYLRRDRERRVFRRWVCVSCHADELVPEPESA